MQSSALRSTLQKQVQRSEPPGHSRLFHPSLRIEARGAFSAMNFALSQVRINDPAQLHLRTKVDGFQHRKTILPVVQAKSVQFQSVP